MGGGVCLWKGRDGVQKEQTEYNGSCEGRDSESGERSLKGVRMRGYSGSYV